MRTPVFTGFVFIDVGSTRIHIFAWDSTSARWLIPCGTTPLFPARDSVTYELTKPLCGTCDLLTRQVSDLDRDRSRADDG